MCHLVRRATRHKVVLTLRAPWCLHKVRSTLCAHQFPDLVRRLVRTLCVLVRDLVRDPASCTRCVNLVRHPSPSTRCVNLVRNPVRRHKACTSPRNLANHHIYIYICFKGTYYAHIEIVVAFLVIKIFSCLIIASWGV